MGGCGWRSILAFEERKVRAAGWDAIFVVVLVSSGEVSYYGKIDG